MRITFVGSSHGVPEAHRKCSCIMLEVGENVYFVDMGTNAIDKLRTAGIAPERVKGIFVTHMHGDHTNGLVPFVDLITWYFKEVTPVIVIPEPKAGKVIADWLEVTLNKQTKEIEYRETRPGVVFDDGVLRVTAFATRHCLKSFAYLVEAEGKRVLFTGDLRNPKEDFPAAAAEGGLDLAVCESAHFAATEYIPVYDALDVKKVCVTHYTSWFVPSVLELFKHLKESGKNAEIATDDFTLCV